MAGSVEERSCVRKGIRVRVGRCGKTSIPGLWTIGWCVNGLGKKK